MSEVHGEESHHLATPELDLDITTRGGMLAPVVFHLPGRDVQPYSLAPWQPSEFPEILPLLSVLRGDFFCLPFGEQTKGPPHGEPANANWTFVSKDERSLRFKMETSDSGAMIAKIISTRAGHHAVYAEYLVSNLEGDFNYGNHPILDLSNLSEGSGRITTSPIRWGSVYPGVFSNPAAGETQALAKGTEFSDPREVKLASGGTTDLTRYPSRHGNEDLVMMVNVAATEEQPFAWSAAVLDGYLWFSLKDPADFPGTVLWITNGGRTAAPWNGRHLGRIGIEEVCSHFHDGPEISRKDLLAKHGIPTTRRFKRGDTISLRTIQAVALVPADFGEVRSIVPNGEHGVLITGESGAAIEVPIDWQFVLQGKGTENFAH